MTLRVAFTVDLEQDAPPFLDTYRGAEEGMPRMLRILADSGVTATVFTTGDVARRYPDLVREIVASGHELGCHGDTHRAFDRMTDAEAGDEIARSTGELRGYATVTAFRAPYLRLPSRHLAVLRAAGYRVDSSEGAYKGVGIRARDDDGLARVPASLTSSALRLPRSFRRVAIGAQSSPVVLFVHPWELVDLRRAPIRWDCRVGTGDHAAAAIADVLADLRARGASFQTISGLVDERRREHARDRAHEGERNATHG
ncbi:MAG TPA: polysaccharide deacetylase family protein [Candidatus Limnocylindria bacterium]|nr:polysaccharide deacetylase family protein [Candidatus Limnocylindria bacterium]